MSAIEERKALDRLSASYRRLVAGGRVPPPEEVPPEVPAQLPAPQQPPQAQPQPEGQPPA